MEGWYLALTLAPALLVLVAIAHHCAGTDRRIDGRNAARVLGAYAGVVALLYVLTPIPAQGLSLGLFQGWAELPWRMLSDLAAVTAAIGALLGVSHATQPLIDTTSFAAALLGSFRLVLVYALLASAVVVALRTIVAWAQQQGEVPDLRPAVGVVALGGLVLSLGAASLPPQLELPKQEDGWIVTVESNDSLLLYPGVEQSVLVERFTVVGSYNTPLYQVLPAVQEELGSLELVGFSRSNAEIHRPAFEVPGALPLGELKPERSGQVFEVSRTYRKPTSSDQLSLPLRSTDGRCYRAVTVVADLAPEFRFAEQPSWHPVPATAQGFTVWIPRERCESGSRLELHFTR